MVVVVDGHEDLIAFVVLDLGVAWVHYFRETRIRYHLHAHFHFHFHLNVMVQIRHLGLCPDWVKVDFAASQPPRLSHQRQTRVTSSSPVLGTVVS